MKRVARLMAMTLVVCSASLPAVADEGNAKRGHHVITVDSMAVHPAKLEITADQVMVWANYSGRTIHVKFPAEVADAFTCAVRPSFYRSATGILSRPIGSLEFALPCSLKPGEYEYEIRIVEAAVCGANRPNERIA